MATQIDNQEFVRAWQTSTGVADVAAKFDITQPQARNRARHLQRLGVPLKKFTRGVKPMNPAELADLKTLAAELGNGEIPPAAEKPAAKARKPR